MRPRSPIERMVDAACGVTDEMLAALPEPPKDPVTIVCTSCSAFRVVEREPAFFDFDIIETTCPDCTSSQQTSGGDRDG